MSLSFGFDSFYNQMEVIKKSGKNEKFSITKLKKSVREAAKDAKIPAKDRTILVEKTTVPIIKVSKTKETIPSKEIKSMIFKKVPKKHEAITKAWKAYEKKK